jgi:hypothetical protein
MSKSLSILELVVRRSGRRARSQTLTPLGADPMSTALAGPTIVINPKSMQRAGRAVTALPVLFLIFDTGIKLLNIAPVVQSMRELGYPEGMGPTLGVIELVCLAAYLLPRTAVLGAVLLTGYLGGATATHVRLGNPLFSHVLFGVYVGVLLWAGLYLREPRLRALLPLRS